MTSPSMAIENFTNFLFLQMFRTGSPQHIGCLITHKDQTMFTIDEAYNIMELRVEADKKLLAIWDKEQPEPEVATFCTQIHPQQSSQQNFGRSQNNQSNKQGFNCGQTFSTTGTPQPDPTTTAMEWPVSTTRFSGKINKSADNRSKPANLAWTKMDDLSGQKSKVLRTPTMLHQYQ